MKLAASNYANLVAFALDHIIGFGCPLQKSGNWLMVIKKFDPK